VRFTPWQSVLVPSVQRGRASAAVQALETAGFACAPSHPFASLIACTGSAGCSAGLADTKGDALRLARALGGTDDVIHFTGCAKSCASASVADTTLLATAPGRYRLYRKGRGDKFGRACAHDIGVSEIAALLRSDPTHKKKGTG
jgi:precorrin-3B synthase